MTACYHIISLYISITFLTSYIIYINISANIDLVHQHLRKICIIYFIRVQFTEYYDITEYFNIKYFIYILFYHLLSVIVF